MELLTIQFQNMVQSFLLFVPRLVVAIIIFLVSLYVAGLAARAVSRALSRRKRPVDPELTLLIERLTRWSIIIFGVIWALNQVNFNVTGFVAGLGIVGFTVGFALKDVAENFVAGMLLLIQQPFDIGDAIEVNGYSGTVTDIKIRDTTIRTWDGLLVIIPNAKVYTNAITNYTRVVHRRLSLSIGVSYDTGLEAAHEVLLRAISSVPGVITDDPAPQVVFKEFGESSINATLYFWIDPQQTGYFAALDAAVKAVKQACDEAGIEIPFPIRTVYMQTTPVAELAG
ncbi:MAG: mechanosensitive ion channel family protein [Chloroflexi bacterium]|nr:MAG: mechanosensitive ion channel family protein [Chloroflexota bacterium]